LLLSFFSAQKDRFRSSVLSTAYLAQPNTLSLSHNAEIICFFNPLEEGDTWFFCTFLVKRETFRFLYLAPDEQMFYTLHMSQKPPDVYMVKYFLGFSSHCTE